MGTALRKGENYLYFPKGTYTGGKVTGITNATVSVVCTHRYLFIFPKKEMTSYLIAFRERSFHFREGVSVEKGLEEMLNDPQMTVEQLENDLVQMLGANDHDRVIEVAELSQFKVHMMWILSQARMSHKAGGAKKVLSVGGPSNMKKFKEFYFPKAS
jgi:hypothetical protein